MKRKMCANCRCLRVSVNGREYCTCVFQGGYILTIYIDYILDLCIKYANFLGYFYLNFFKIKFGLLFTEAVTGGLLKMWCSEI